jgi:hypothetical protein
VEEMINSFEELIILEGEVIEVEDSSDNYLYFLDSGCV